MLINIEGEKHIQLFCTNKIKQINNKKQKTNVKN